MNVVVAIKDYTELDRLVRPLTVHGHQVTPVTKYAALLRTLAALQPDVVVLDWGFGGGGDEQVVKSVRGPGPDGPRILMLVPERWPPEAAQLFGWGAHDFARRPICMSEVVARIDQMAGGAARSATEIRRGAPDAWRNLAFWRDLEDIVTAELGATIGVNLTRGSASPAPPMSVVGLSRLLLLAEGLEVVIGVGVDAVADTPLAAALLGGPPTPDIMGDVVTELTNVAAGAIKRSALEAGKVFSMGLPRLHHDPARTFALERHWRAHGDQGIAVHCLAEARASKPEVVACSALREGMVVNGNVVSPSGMLLAAQGTCLTDRSVERLRSMLGERFAIEVTMPAFSL